MRHTREVKMISILATVDGSPASRAVIPALEKLAADLSARATLLTVVERPKATPRRDEVVQAPYTGVPAVPGGIEAPSVLRSREPRYAETDDQAIDRAIAEGREFLESAAKPLKDRGIEVQTEVVVNHNVAAAIVDFAREQKFDIIAMATHGRGGLNQLVQGSVASAVVKSGIAPVLLIRPSKAR
jgi:nucleotide-binding universal stress UspA family protein